MQRIEPSEFDLVVIGTGLIESIVAAAAAKAGHSVLQLDPASHYGGAWATLRMDELQAALLRQPETAEIGSTQSPPRHRLPGVRSGRVFLHPSAAASLAAPSAYNLDLSPHVLYGSGPMISLLLGSGAHNYTEYKLVQSVTVVDLATGASREVPSTRAQIFRDKTLTPLQKRSLMRFLKGCGEAMEGRGPLVDRISGSGGEGQQTTFKQVMEEEELDARLQEDLAHGVLLQHGHLGGQLHSDDALRLLRLYVGSVGRYGVDAGPFLAPMYGCGELPQAFCRAAAVAGAVQVLRCRVAGLTLDEHTLSCTAVVVDREEVGGDQQQTIGCGRLAAGPEALQQLVTTFGLPVVRHCTARCVAVLDGPAVSDAAQAVVSVPGAGPGGVTVWGLQVGRPTGACPETQSVLHLWCDVQGAEAEEVAASTAQNALLPCLEALANCREMIMKEPMPMPKPTVLWAAFFSIETSSSAASSAASWPSNVVLCSGPTAAVALAEAVDAAKGCYWSLYPADREDDFFPLEEGARRRGEEADAGGEDSDSEAVAALEAALGVGTAAVLVERDEEGEETSM